MPTILNEYILLSKNASNFVFSFIAFVNAVMPFITLTIYKLMNENDVLLIRLTFLITAASFAGLLIVPFGIFKVIFLLIIKIMNGIVTALLWSIYIPALGKTGRVSSINGIMDCTGYIAASITTSIFAYAVTNLGWNGSIIVWMVLSFLGIVATFMRKSA